MMATRGLGPGVTIATSGFGPFGGVITTFLAIARIVLRPAVEAIVRIRS